MPSQIAFCPETRRASQGRQQIRPSSSNDSAEPWESDPTGRYKLRRRDDDWHRSDHVYDDNGTMGNDRHYSSAQRSPEQDSRRHAVSTVDGGTVTEVTRKRLQPPPPSQFIPIQVRVHRLTYKREQVTWQFVPVYCLSCSWPGSRFRALQTVPSPSDAALIGDISGGAREAVIGHKADTRTAGSSVTPLADLHDFRVGHPVAARPVVDAVN